MVAGGDDVQDAYGSAPVRPPSVGHAKEVGPCYDPTTNGVREVANGGKLRELHFFLCSQRCRETDMWSQVKEKKNEKKAPEES